MTPRQPNSPPPTTLPKQLPFPLLDDLTVARWWRTIMMVIGTDYDLERAALEIKQLYASTPEQQEANAVGLEKLREAYRIRKGTSGDPR